MKKKHICLLIFFASILNIRAQEYCVTKIDSTESSYIIHIKDKNFSGIIVSEKQNCKGDKTKILTNCIYNLQIYKYPPLDIINVPDLKVKSEGKPSIIIGGINVCELDENCTVYKTDNLCGLYFIK